LSFQVYFGHGRKTRIFYCRGVMNHARTPCRNPVGETGNPASRGKGLTKLAKGQEKPVPMSTSKADRKERSTVREKYGEDYYQRIGKKGGNDIKEKRGSDHYGYIAKNEGK